MNIMRATFFAATLFAVTGLMVAVPVSAAEAEFDAAIKCGSCEYWNQPQVPFKIYGNTYYVGTIGLSSILIASDNGLILLDGDLPQSAPLIDANIRSLGFRTEDIRLIVNSHVHFDHVGGIAALQRATGAIVAASVASAKAIKAGVLQRDDPQFGLGRQSTAFPAVKEVKIVKDGEVLRVGSLAITAHLTPGHTAGGTTWTWKSCEQSRCLNIVYADSLNAVSSDDYRFSDHPQWVESFHRSITVVEKLPCDILISVHPEFADIQGKLARIKADQQTNPFIDNQACQHYAADAAEKLKNRLLTEQQAK